MTEQAVPPTAQFRPFYEWIPDRFPIPLIVKLMLSGLLGFLFLAPHYMVVQGRVLDDWSWLLCSIIVTAMICLYYATHTFRSMFSQMNLRLRAEDGSIRDSVYLDPIRQYLSDKKFLSAGLLFAVLNCGVGYLLKIPERGPGDTFYLGFFLAGFVCGMAVCGIRGVVVTLTRYLNQGQPKVDYTNPDGCGGFLFLGEALIKFSAVTLVVGVLISLYTLTATVSSPKRSEAVYSDSAGEAVSSDKPSHTGPSDKPPEVPSDNLIRVIMWLWIAFPFLLSLTILLAPASRANQALMNHKIQKEVELALLLDKARDSLQKAGTDTERQEQLRHEIEYYAKLRDQLHRMRSWPLNPQTNIKFIILFVSNAFVAIQSVQQLL